MINIIIILTINCSTYFLKRFYNRETIAASNYEIQQMSFIPPPPQWNKQPQIGH